MNVLMLVLNQTGQGTYWRALHLGRGLARRGHRVTLVSTSRTEKFHLRTSTNSDLELVEAPDLLSGSLRSGWDPWNVLRRLHFLRGRRFDLVHAFEARPTVLLPALYLRRRQQLPLVMDWADWFGRGGSVEERPNKLVRAVLRPVETFFEERFRTQAAATTVICTTLRHKALALGVPPAKILQLPNGSDTENLQVLPIEAARRALGLPEQAYFIGYVGTVFQRDAQLMAEAFDRVCRQVPAVRLLMIGHSPFDLRRLVEKPDQIIQTGYVPGEDLNRFLAACDLFWLPLADRPANRGRFPLKLTDYLAAGRPVVATAVGDIPEVFAQAEIGRLASPNPAELAGQVVLLLEDAAGRARLGREARRLAESRYDWNVLAGELETLYRGLQTGDAL